MKQYRLNHLCILTAAAMIIVFSGHRCEKHRRKKPVTAGSKTTYRPDASSSKGAGDASLDAADSAAKATADVSEVSHEAADPPDGAADAAAETQNEGKEITFKHVPKIPSFKPHPDQPVADVWERENLTNHEKTCKILSEGQLVHRKGKFTFIPMKRERVADGLSWRFKFLMALSEDSEAITGFFKPRQTNYWDWLKEAHAYSVGKLIGAPTIPTVLRFFPKTRFSWWLNKKPPEETEMFIWEGKKNPKVRGAFKYWVPSYWHRRLGRKLANEDYMNAIAKSLHPGNRKELEENYDIYLQLGRGIIFDYLIINEDRPENLGTILLPDGSHQLVLIDNGLALGVEHGGRTTMKNMFLKMRMFPRDMIDKIRALDDEELEKMLRPPDDPVMWLPEVCIKQLIKRKEHILETVDKWHEKWGDAVWY